MHRYRISIFLIGAAYLAALSAEEMAFGQPETDEIALDGSVIAAKGKEPVLISQLRQIALINQKNDVQHFKGQERVGVQAYNVHVPGDLAGLNGQLQPYFKRPLREADIKEIIEKISKYYIDHYYPMVIIEVPSQEVTSGILQLVVIESRIGGVVIENEQARSKKIMAKYMDLRRGDQINEQEILKNVDFINRNPFRRADVIYTSGHQPYTTDVVLRVEERRPLRVYSGFDNTGVDSIGRQRWYLGLNTGYLFGQDIVFAYQFTASTQFHRFWSQTAQMQIMLPWKHVLNVYGGYSTVHVNLSQKDFSNHGGSYQASGRYTIPLNPTRYLRHETGIGFDFKRTNNSVLFTETVLFFGKNVNLTQLVGRYIGNYEGKSFRIDFDLEGYWSPGRWISDQSNADFSSIRPGAKNHWFYARSGLLWHQQIGKGFWLNGQFRGQLASGNLLPSEQMGIGGYETVRGYDEREFNADSGLILNFEIRSPHFPVLTIRNRKPNAKDAMQFLIFGDYGLGSNHTTLPGQSKTQFLIGAGPGVRYTFDPYITLRADYGFKIHKNAQFVGLDLGKFHFSANASY